MLVAIGTVCILLSSINFLHLNLLLWNHLSKWSKTWSEAYMEGLLLGLLILSRSVNKHVTCSSHDISEILVICYWTTITHSPTSKRPVWNLVLKQNDMPFPWICYRTPLKTYYHSYVISNYCKLWTWIRYHKNKVTQTLRSRYHGYSSLKLYTVTLISSTQW
jgi:hypothetical protein